MVSNFRVEECREEDLPDLVELIIPTFAQYAMEIFLGNIDTPEAIHAATERHIRAWREHMDETGRPCAIKCVHRDPDSGKETLVACGEWFIFDKPRSPEDMRKVHHLISASWLEGERRQKAERMFKPVIDTRAKWLSGQGHAILMFLATDKAWRRQGAAKSCVKWGLEKCEELRIPAYLEASQQGRPVYERLGFEVVEQLHMDVEEEKSFEPAMMWWPPGTKPEYKKPVVLQ